MTSAGADRLLTNRTIKKGFGDVFVAMADFISRTHRHRGCSTFRAFIVN
jgi:hypothetical protein